MILNTLSSVLIFSTMSLSQMITGQVNTVKPVVASEKILSLNDRQFDKTVNSIFKDNILLNMAYLDGKVTKGSVNWAEVNKPFNYELVLNKDETFAYHDSVLPEYQGKIAKTSNAHFNSAEGFKSDGYLVGDGVCHLASIIYWVAKDGGLEVKAPTNHNFAVIPDVPREYGVSIYNSGTKSTGDGNQNLYITNNQGQPVIIKFEYDGESLKVSVIKTGSVSAI